MHQQKSLRKGNIKYDYTQHHRNYAAIRLEPDAQNPPKQPASAADAAPTAAHAAAVRFNLAEERAVYHKVAAEERFHTAVSVKTMDTKKDVLCRELDALKLEDQRRKYWNAGGGPSGLASRRVGFVKLSEGGRKDKFVKTFGIGAFFLFILGFVSL
ncbi:hypothetical protein BCR33DRAFT_561921 [Rhizoclosmatium globosum]|uniref:Uncharacterized protein n=1 Tax=Rhizoclosmatium globosum TaxID=329046 RepID=A0A1Y2CSS6_9FUNG|nr:hypothetical protein BCR33DRAFT_561921 [Rhizoclosmatium globosum]|eukprot:ORY50089.1 hypothetical protein BCR33DRAFT_561921 [Rhizoclosmatium globosum]